eukprot:scaffold3712_cov234-Chaetoceros_neogracile.AAC.1
MKIDSVSQTVLFFTLVHTGSSGWVDPDTSAIFQGTAALTKGDNRQYELVFSDEFETEGRSFADGEDSRWTAIDKNDCK